MNAVLMAALQITDQLLGLYIMILVVGAVLSWLVAFGIINSYNRFVQVVGDFYYRITDPLLRPIRRYIRPINGLDLSPLVLFFGIEFIQYIIHNTLFRLALGR